MRKLGCFGIGVLSLLILLATVGYAKTVRKKPLRIVEGGKARATIILSRDASSELKFVANTLAEYIEKSSGAILPTTSDVGEIRNKNFIRIHIGRNNYVNSLNLGLEKLDEDGFLIRCIDNRNIVIAGPTRYGTEFGVYEFLERYVGVRWLLPGPEGEDVPLRKTIEVSRQEVRQDPAFFSRLLSGWAGPYEKTWARRMRIRARRQGYSHKPLKRIQFHHNMWRLFPPGKYTKTHPHFYPIVNGKRYLLPPGRKVGWQPCFTAEGIVEEAVKNICEYFANNPEATSYSLGVNDDMGQCQCKRCLSCDSGKKNYLGFRDASDRYYQWCNEAIEGVHKKYPHKYFGCLAYCQVAQAPAHTKLNPYLIPLMAYDRMKWINPGDRTTGEKQTKLWQKAATNLGWYDYIYGTPYCLPRVYFHQMAAYLRFGYEHGVTVYYAEAYPNWGEGPKLYITLKLLWNPYQDVDELLRDWYVRAVGEDAADDLAAYYEHWEDFWTRRILVSDWWLRGHGQWLNYHDASYLWEVSESEIAKCRSLLEAVVAKTKTSQQKARAEILLRAFEYYEASALAYPENPRVKQPAIKSESDALEIIDRAVLRRSMAERRRRLALVEFPGNQLLQHKITINNEPLLEGSSWGQGELWQVFDWVSASERVRRRIQELAKFCPSESVSNDAQSMLLILEGKGTPVSLNPSFEEGKDDKANDWKCKAKWGIGWMERSKDMARTGKYSLLAEEVKQASLKQELAIQPGYYVATAFIRTAQLPKGKATLELRLTLKDAANRNLSSFFSTIRPRVGRWNAIATGLEVPDIVKNKRVKKIQLALIIKELQAGEKVYIDDLGLYKIKYQK